MTDVGKGTRFIVAAIGMVVVLGVVTALVVGLMRTKSAAVGESRMVAIAPVAPQSGECIASRPCKLPVRSDGSTDVIKVPNGMAVCFNPEFWDKVEQLGYRNSLYGRPEVQYTCTKEQVLNGTCEQKYFDTFRFVPRAGVAVPDYWFMPFGSTQC